ncbi:MAG TPA: ATP-binding protein [Pseudolysinimonas sp.]|jgi:two-component system OmpR family sensor kinase|nr:ATP-binding protein [Pseudolysinimonas sp.]
MRPRWSLQRRLVLALVALLAVVSLIVGATSVLALRQNLVGRLDQQVGAELRFLEGILTGQPATQGDPLGARASVRLVQASDGSTIHEYVDAERESRPLTSTQQQQLLAGARGEHPVDVTLDGIGQFRVASGDRGGIRFIVGLSTADVTATTDSLMLIFALVTLAALLIAAVAGTLVVRVALRPLGRFAATATRVSELPLDKGEVALAERLADDDADPRTEVGQVGSAFNRMLGHIESALVARQHSEDRVRQFVADASHELRTPLASIRGYSELTRRGGHTLPDDVVRALGRIESESVRMTSLVEDLLLLARLDAGRELVLGAVDLVPLVADAVSDAHAASPGHEWSLDAPDSPVIVSGDGGRLHQVVANLLANARVHTPEGTRVDTVLGVEDGHAVLTVTDDGPGISAQLQSVLFERFARGDGSRARATGSTGLGLSIVAAVVEGHGGQVSVESEPGRTRFTVRLPLKAAVATAPAVV